MKIALRVWCGFLLFAVVLYAFTGLPIFAVKDELQGMALVGVYMASLFILMASEGV